jgi:hypothetical protein
MRGRSISAAERRTQRKLSGLFALFALGVATQRLALPLGAQAQLPVAFLIYWFAVFWLGLEGIITPLKTMALVLGLAFGAVLTCSMLATGIPQLSSLAYLLALYVPFSFGTTGAIGPHHMRRAGRFFVSMMMAFALLAIMQFATQRFLHMPYVDPLGSLPDAVVLQGYLTSYPIFYGADLYKSNAYLFVEASLLSQFLGLAIIIELSLFRRVLPLILLVAALATTFSGTGALLIAAVSPLLFMRYWSNPRTIVLGLLAIGVMTAEIATHPELLSRIGEFGGRDTSASARFVEPYLMMVRESFGDVASFLFGHGAGAANRLVTSSDSLVNFSAVPKAVIEYGLLGGGAMLLAIVFRIALSGQPAIVAIALIVMHYFLSGALLQPISVLLLFFFIATGARPVRSERATRAASPTLAGSQA